MRETRYKDAGVDIAAADEAKRRIAGFVSSTHGPSVLGGIGGFGGLYSLDNLPEDPVLVSSVDGVGTKLKLAFSLKRHGTVGEDLVNHCINDILVQGARPLFFMDYLATGSLEPCVVEEIVEGIARACRNASCALLGGETAEMPGFYGSGEYDLAGMIVGVAGRDRLITGNTIESGDIILGLSSSGLHTNGYSLARKVLLDDGGMALDRTYPPLDRELGDVLLEPHRCYASSVLPLLEDMQVKGMVHITGGGYAGNIPRVVPPHLRAVIDKGAWHTPPVFRLIAETGGVPEDEMYAAFNMGIGMLVITAREEADAVGSAMAVAGENVFEVGHIEQRNNDEPDMILR